MVMLRAEEETDDAASHIVDSHGFQRVCCGLQPLP